MKRFFLTIIFITTILCSFVVFGISEVKAEAYYLDKWVQNNDLQISELGDKKFNIEGTGSEIHDTNSKFSGYGYWTFENDLFNKSDDMNLTFEQNSYTISFWYEVNHSSYGSWIYINDDGTKANMQGYNFAFKLTNSDIEWPLFKKNEDGTEEHCGGTYDGPICERIDHKTLSNTLNFNANDYNFYIIEITSTNLKIYVNTDLWLEFVLTGDTFNTSTFKYLGINQDNFVSIVRYADIAIYDGVLTPTEKVSLYESNESVDTYSALDPVPTETTNNYIMYYSENPKYVELTETTNLQYVYNVCDSFTNYDTLVVNLYDETDTLINQKALTYNDFDQCSGTDTIQFTAGISENTQNYYIEITNMDTDYSYNTNQFMISEYESIENSNLTFIEPNFNSFQTFDIADTATSTTLNFQYNFCDTSYFDNLTTPKIFLYNENSNNLTSISTNTIDSCGGIINLDFPLATEIIGPQNFSTKLIDDNDNNVYYYEKNNTFQISFYDSSINYEIGDITSTSTIISIFGVNTHDLVCDDSQWNSGNILTTAYCNALKKSIDIPLKFLTWGETKIVQSYNKIKEMPPFNIIFQFQESWQNAEPQLGINKLLGIKTVNAQSTNINDNITVPEIGQGFTFNFPLQDNNVEFTLFNKANMEKYLGTQTLNLIRILGNIALLSLFFLYLYYRIKNFTL
jgi:hypothetical protein